MKTHISVSRQKTEVTYGDTHLARTLLLGMAFLFTIAFVSCGDDNATRNPVNSDIPPDTTETGFEWTSAPPQEHGFVPELLDTVTARLTSGELGRVTSLLIARDGYLVYEEYFRGVGRDDMVNIYSCTKSVAAALIGIAISEGDIPGVGAKISDYMGGYTFFPDNTGDSLYRASLTLEHLLTMTAGFDWHELDVPYGNPLNSYNQMVNSADWLQFTLNQPVVREPGTTFCYNTGLSGLMAVILQESTGRDIVSYAREKLFSQIGIERCSWRLTPTGVPMTGNGLRLRPRDMAKFGWLYSQGGKWGSQTVVPASWVETSHQSHVILSDNQAYGYQWWMAKITDDQDNALWMPYALGYGGQHIFVPPIEDLVIVVTADDDQEVSGNYIATILDLIGQAMTP